MEISVLEIIALLFGGVLAGMINTVAGSGSAVTLSLLMFLHPDAALANGTNRIGVIAQGIVGYSRYRKAAEVPRNTKFSVLLPGFFGALLGAWATSLLSKSSFETAIGILMLFMLFLVLANPKRWLSEEESAPKLPAWGSALLFFFAGVYAGFIQAGVGVVLLVGLVNGLGMIPKKANTLKLLFVLLLNIPAFLLFVYWGQVAWWPGLLLAGGQAVGSLLAARVALRHPQANLWVRNVLIGIIVVAIWRFLHLEGFCIFLTPKPALASFYFASFAKQFAYWALFPAI